jgi:HAD superfamily hydrolase (TIGR01549 family)
MDTEVDTLVNLIKDKRKTNLIFDFDETLTFLDLPWDEWINDVTNILPKEKQLEFKRILEKEGSSWGIYINKVITEDNDFFDKLLQISLQFEAKHFKHTPYQELINVLPELREMGCSLYLWTNNTRPTVDKALIELGVLDLFTKIVTKEDTKLNKPNKRGWELIKKDSEPLVTYLFVGDSLNDKKAAELANIDYFKINYFKK